MTRTVEDYSIMLPVATDSERQYLEAWEKHGTYKAACEALGRNESSMIGALKNLRVRAAKAGIAPESDWNKPVPEGYMVKGVSSYYNRDGELTGQWVKSSADTEKMAAMMESARKAMMEDVPKAIPVAPPAVTLSDLASLYVITDYHLGMLSWAEETGAAWDIKIAEDLLFAWFSKAIALSPASEVGIFGQLGDFMHFDGLDSVTPTNRHILDADTRFDKLVRVAIRVTRRIIDLLLTKHKKVHLILAEGNHDPASSAWLRSNFYDKYENEPRITVDRSPKPYYAFEWGHTSLFFHHSHKKAFAGLDVAFTGMFPDIFGRTKFRYGHSGHLHHKQMKESSLMVLEQHRTLAAPDAYAIRGAWLSGRSSDVIIYSKKCGQIGRHTIPYEMIAT